MHPINHALQHARLMWTFVITIAVVTFILISSLEIPGWGLLALLVAGPALVVLMAVALDGTNEHVG